MFLPFPKATVLVTTGGRGSEATKHLFVLLTHGLGPEEEVLMVSVSTVRPEVPYDDACVLAPGSHPFVKQASYVRFDKSRRVQQQKISAAVNDGTFVAHEPVSDEVYSAICAGLMKSAHADPATKAFLAWHENLAD